MAKKFKTYTQFDPVYHEIVAHSREMKAAYEERDREYKEYERMFNMDWTHELDVAGHTDTIKPTISPTARNKIMGAWRLLISQEPKFKLRSDIADPAQLEKLENFISSMWVRAGTYNGRPLHHDIILSMLLYGEAHIAVNTLKDFQEYNPEDRRIERASKITPVIFDIFNPKTGYPEFDKFGLSAYYREVEVDKSWVRTNYAKLIESQELNYDLRGSGRITLKLYWDLKNYCVHVGDKLLLCREHGLPSIPVSVAMSDGSNLFEDNEDNRQPMLFTLKRSKLWERENLYLTVTTSNLFSLGCMPLLAFTHDQGTKLNINNDAGILIADIAKGDNLDFVQSKGFLTNEMQNMGKMYADYIDDSTIYDNAFGASSSAGSFSETSLLSVSARLPLVATQRQCGAAIAGAVDLALMTMKERGINFSREGLEIKAKDIPEDLEITCKLDMTQPQERLQRANEAAVILANGLASKQWTQENTIGIENTDEMDKAMLREKVNAALVDYKIQDLVQEMQKQKQQEEQQKEQEVQQAVQQAQAAQQQAVQQRQQAQQEQMLQQQQQSNMGGARQIPAGQQLETEMLMMLQQQAMQNNMNPSGQNQMPEGQAERLGGGGMAGGMPPEMGGLLPGMGAGVGA